jgi:hypothetical protein
MRPKELILRCYGERKADLWQTFCIDLGLATQGESFQEAKDKLHAQIVSYMQEALAGADREYADQLLSRKSPLEFRLRYHYYSLLCYFNTAKTSICQIFNEVMPLTLSQNQA